METIFETFIWAVLPLTCSVISVLAQRQDRGDNMIEMLSFGVIAPGGILTPYFIEFNNVIGLIYGILINLICIVLVVFVIKGYVKRWKIYNKLPFYSLSIFTVFPTIIFLIITLLSPEPDKIQQLNSDTFQESFDNVRKSYEDIVQVLNDENENIESAIKNLLDSIDDRNKQLRSIDTELNRLKNESEYYQRLVNIDKEEVDAINKELMRNKHIDLLLGILSGFIVSSFFFWLSNRKRFQPNRGEVID